MSRLTSESDDATRTVLESPQYLGTGTVVERDHPEDGVTLSYISAYGLTGDAGDQYTGLDRFGRVVDQKWVDSTGAAVDEYQYGYDRDGNVLYKLNVVNPADSELYVYDNLNRLVEFQRGTLAAGDASISGRPSETESWTLDALGNQTAVDLNGTTTSQTFNMQNEMTSGGGATLYYDADGNLVQDQRNYTYLYDAWDRMALSDYSPPEMREIANRIGPQPEFGYRIELPTGAVEDYVYDALGRRIRSMSPSTGLYEVF